MKKTQLECWNIVSFMASIFGYSAMQQPHLFYSSFTYDQALERLYLVFDGMVFGLETRTVWEWIDPMWTLSLAGWEIEVPKYVIPRVLMQDTVLWIRGVFFIRFQ